MSGIVVPGALHHDVVVDAPRMPKPDESLPGTQVDYRIGGQGGNQAVAAARMGARVVMAGQVGRESAAETMRAAMDAAGIEHALVPETDAPTGMSVVITPFSGKFGAVTVSGANLDNDGKNSRQGPPLAGLLQIEIPEAQNHALAPRLPFDSRPIASALPACRLPVESAERIDVLIVNLFEAEGLTGYRNPEAALSALAGTMRGVLTQGAKGAILMEDGQMTHHPAISTKVVSTNGAGDMFTGALAARITAGDSLQSALRLA